MARLFIWSNMAEKKESNYSGIPMDEKGIADWQNAFIEIEDSINELYKDEKKTTKKTTKKKE